MKFFKKFIKVNYFAINNKWHDKNDNFGNETEPAIFGSVRENNYYQFLKLLKKNNINETYNLNSEKKNEETNLIKYVVLSNLNEKRKIKYLKKIFEHGGKINNDNIFNEKTLLGNDVKKIKEGIVYFALAFNILKNNNSTKILRFLIENGADVTKSNLILCGCNKLINEAEILLEAYIKKNKNVKDLNETNFTYAEKKITLNNNVLNCEFDILVLSNFTKTINIFLNNELINFSKYLTTLGFEVDATSERIIKDLYGDGVCKEFLENYYGFYKNKLNANIAPSLKKEKKNIMI